MNTFRIFSALYVKLFKKAKRTQGTDALYSVNNERKPSCYAML